MSSRPTCSTRASSRAGFKVIEKPCLKKMIGLSYIEKLDDGSIALWVLVLKFKATSRQMHNNKDGSIHENLDTWNIMELGKMSS